MSGYSEDPTAMLNHLIDMGILPESIAILVVSFLTGADNMPPPQADHVRLALASLGDSTRLAPGRRVRIGECFGTVEHDPSLERVRVKLDGTGRGAAFPRQFVHVVNEPERPRPVFHPGDWVRPASAHGRGVVTEVRSFLQARINLIRYYVQWHSGTYVSEGPVHFEASGLVKIDTPVEKG